MKLPPLALAYHGIAEVPYPADPRLLFVGPDDLRRHVDRLRRWGYRLVSFRTLAVAPRSGLAALTFDDGLVDGLDSLIDLRRTEDVPATVFVPSGWLGRPHPDVPRHRVVDAAELRDLARAGVDIGGHTVRHPRLTRLSEMEALAELRLGRLQLEAILHRAIDVAAYPYGAANDETRRACRAAGYVAACRTDGAGLWNDPFDVPRQAMHNSASLVGLRLKRRGWYETAMRSPAVDRVRRRRRRLHSAARVARWRVDVEPLARGWAIEWSSLERRGAQTPYLRHDWLGAWLAVYRPPEVLMVRVRGSDGRALALGMVEVLSNGGWRFAGCPVTPDRRLLCAPGAEAECWRAVARVAPDRLDAEGVPRADLRLTTAEGRSVPWFELALPSSLSELFASRPPAVRKGLKQTLRRLARANASLDAGSALLDHFLPLHHARARTKGEHHPHMDERLPALLRRVPARVLGLRIADAVVAVTVRLDHGDGAFVYNAGFDPSWGHLSPGVGLELGSIENAIACDLCRFDLGPGDYRHKRDVGARVTETLAVATLRG